MRRIPLILLLVVGAVLPGAAQSAAQPADSSLRVTVTDATGAVIVGARVTVRQPGGEAREAATGDLGVAVVTGLWPAPADLSVEAAGFESAAITGRNLRAGTNRLEVQLGIAGFAMAVEVSRDARERQLDPRGDAFTRILTADMLAQLPDDPAEFERVIQQLAGPGATIRVNGFSARLPPKGQIRQIRFSLNSYSADVHTQGAPTVDIITQPGIERWHVSLNVGFRNDPLTARYAYAPASSSEQSRRLGFTVDGPVWKDHTTLLFTLDTSSLSDTQTILASMPSGPFVGLASRPSGRSGYSMLAEHAVTPAHILRAEFSRTAVNLRNLGVGGTNLPERGYSSEQTSRVFRLSDSGSIGKRWFNEVRAQLGWTGTRMQSVTAQPAIVVLGAFAAGGAQIDSTRGAWEVELADNLDTSRGRHAFRTGGLLQAGRYRAADQGNRLGTFTFSGLDAYRVGTPASFTRRVGDPRVEFAFYRAGWYLQDDIKVHKSLTLGVGLRHEIQSHIEGCMNLSPRVGITWAPLPNGALLVRAGAGLVYDWFDPSLYEQTLQIDGVRAYDVVIANPGFPDAQSGGLRIELPPSRYLAAPHLRLPHTLSTSVAVQRQFTPTTSLVTSYTLQRGTGLFRGRNLNAPLQDGARPDPTLGNVLQVEAAGRSRLDRLDVVVSRVGMKQGQSSYLLSGYYSLSRQQTDTDGPFSPPSDSYHPSADWGPAVSDVRHRLVGMASVSLPKNFRVMTTMSLSSAAPYNITTGYDDNHDTVFNDRPAGVGRNSARGAAALEVTARVGWTWGIGKAPAKQTDIPDLRRRTREARRDPLGAVAGAFGSQAHRYRLEFYAQASNVLNRVNPVGFRGVLTSPYYGRATASLPPRRIELGARFDY